MLQQLSEFSAESGEAAHCRHSFWFADTRKLSPLSLDRRRSVGYLLQRLRLPLRLRNVHKEHCAEHLHPDRFHIHCPFDLAVMFALSIW